MDAHLYRPGWRWEDLGLLTGLGTLTALQIREGGEKGKWREKGVREEVEIFNK